MEAQPEPEKIYVAIGDDKQDGFSTLSWVLKKWSNSNSSISIVILYATIPSFKDGFIQTYFGKMPANYVNDATVEALRKTKEEDNDKLLSEYQAFCGINGKVQTEILKIRKYDEPIHKLLVDLISGLGATKLVMDIAFMKYSSWKSKGNNAIGDTFYIQRNKPDFCQLFIVCGGKLMFLREDSNYSDGILVEDENGVLIASNFKEKGSGSSGGSNSIRGFLGKMLSVGDQKNLLDSPSSAAGRYSPNQWDNSVHDLEKYFSELMNLNDDFDDNIDDDQAGSKDDILMENQNSPPETMIDSEKFEALRMKINKARETIQQMRNEAKGNVERQAKAEWAHSLCTLRAKELESRINEEVLNQTELKKEFENIKDQEYDISKEVEDKLEKLKSIVEVQDELSSRLHISSLARSRADLELEKAVSRRTDMVRQIEELRRQRDVLHRRIEFCKEKDAIRAANQLGGELEFQYKQFDAQEIRKATQDFSDNLRLKSAGNLTNVYKCRINRTFVAIKLFSDQLSHEAFQSKVQLLGQIHHPNIVSMIGFCTELKCIVFEFMHHGSLRDVLFGSRKRNKFLNWHSRIAIASQVSSGLGFIHSARPSPIAHGNLDPSKILLNHSLVAKIHGIRLIWCQNESETKPDIRSFGNLVLQLLTGRNWAGLVIDEKMLDNHDGILKVLDPMAGQWPMDLALEFAGIGLRCLSMEIEPESGSPITRIAREMEKVRRDADELVGGTNVSINNANKGGDMEESSEVPRVFVCPIFKRLMKNPYVAADGFSYELEAIEEWLSKGNDTSPITKLKLNRKTFTPNHTLRSLIQDWHHQRLNY